jgi:hypothetical protein
MEERPNGARSNLYRPTGVMNVAELTFFVQWTLIIPLGGIKKCKVPGFRSSNVSYGYCWRCGLESLMLDKAVKVDSRMHSQLFFSATTMAAHQSVGSVCLAAT